METNYTPGQILYIKPEYGMAYISVLCDAVKRTYAAYELDSYELHTCCDLTIHEYSEHMYEGGMTFAKGNGTMLDVDTNFEEIRQAEDFEKKMLFNALVRSFKEYDLGWADHFTDSTYDDIRDWLYWALDVDLDNMDDNNPMGVTIYEITNYIWDVLCKETGNYQACTDYAEPEMVNKDKFIAKVRNWLEKHTYDDKYWTPDGDDLFLGNLIDELVKYLEE